MRVYMAGKVSKYGGWRSDITGHDFSGCQGNWAWRDLEFRFGAGMTYVGPFFLGCDHGCAHSLGEHGQTREMCVPDRAAPSESVADLRRYRAPAPDQVSGEMDALSPHRSFLHRKCLDAIDSSDLVFCWLDDVTAFGTLWELGYARGKGVQVALGIPEGLDVSDQWFAVYGANMVFRADTPAHAFRRVFDEVDRHLHFMRCESPIERAFLSALLDVKPDGVRVYPQKQVGPYRLDFALSTAGASVAVECDGHDFHEKTRKQAARDKKRDRYLVREGWRVLRFTGSEIHSNAKRCVHEVLDALSAPSGPEAAE